MDISGFASAPARHPLPAHGDYSLPREGGRRQGVLSLVHVIYVTFDLALGRLRYLTPSAAKTVSRSAGLTSRRRPFAIIFSISSNPWNNRIFAAPYCSAPVRARPWAAAQSRTTESGRKT